MNSLIGPFLGGITFAVGLGISGMTETAYIIGFLDITGNWQPQLIFVMLGPLAINIVFYQWIIKRDKPLVGDKFFIPTNNIIDKRLVLGAGLFGIGWGLTGLCPGPALTSLISGSLYIFVFVIFMLTGILIAQKVFK